MYFCHLCRLYLEVQRWLAKISSLQPANAAGEHLCPEAGVFFCAESLMGCMKRLRLTGLRWVGDKVETLCVHHSLLKVLLEVAWPH